MLEFSSILSAVKPRDRTDKYLILASLFALDSHTVAVTAKQVTELLTLHLGKSTPANVNASLRKYTSCVEVSEKGPPLRWKITAKGMDELRKLSGLSLVVAAAESDFTTDVAFICALPFPEHSALLNATGGSDKWVEAGTARFPHLYHTTNLSTNHGKSLKCVSTIASSMGLTAAAIATTQMILQFRPRIVIMVGIAAGTRSGNKQFGDVLVADPSVDYNSGKVILEKGVRGFLPDPYPIGLNARLRSVLQKYGPSHDVFDRIRSRWNGNVPTEPNRVHIGPLGAADQVIDDATRVIEIQRNWRKLIGVEMETYGVYRACHEAPDPKPRFVSFKSVCDFAAEKTDSWQEYAAFVAAEFAISFVQEDWEYLWPSN